MPAGKLASDLAISRATLARLLAAAGDGVVRIGKGRRTSYVASRRLRGTQTSLPMFRVGIDGECDQVATLHLAHPHGTVMVLSKAIDWPLTSQMQEGWFEGIPFLLYDLRPNGYLGRAFARRVAGSLQLSEDPRQWSDDEVLSALSIYGFDGSGNYIVGESALRLWLDDVSKRHDPIRSNEVAASYESLASAAINGDLVGSSAVGEFPKFTALRERDGNAIHVIVKFSGSDHSESSTRWADLLVCEALAADSIRQLLGLEAARSTIHQTATRTFLEVERFDRHGAHGRSALCSWAAINHDWIGSKPNDWINGARGLRQMGLVSQETQSAVSLLWLFGGLIGNTDMHDGNVSFTPANEGVRIAPSYDMLPMLYAPLRGVELPAKNFRPSLPVPSERNDWNRAAIAAVAFWAAAAADPRISAPFREICANNASLVQEMISIQPRGA